MVALWVKTRSTGALEAGMEKTVFHQARCTICAVCVYIDWFPVFNSKKKKQWASWQCKILEGGHGLYRN